MAKSSTLPRILMLVLIACLIAAGLYVAFGTHVGAQLRQDPHVFHEDVRRWVAAHRVLAPLIVIGLYVVLTVAMLPLWWVPVLAGAGFGLAWGVVWSQLGATLGAVAAFSLSRWIAADYFHGHVESKMARLRALDEKLSHNGLLVVLVARLIHVLPFGPSYYMFGLIAMTAADVALGTLLGYLPVCMLLVKTGVGWRHGHTLRFVLALLVIQGLLLTPVLLRYLAPNLFKKVGIE
jgi:uncharacterized membrane protein YdjX (TVP38/TMEM64 family)